LIVTIQGSGLRAQGPGPRNSLRLIIMINTMNKTLLWILAFIITLGAAYYQRKTGPTYPSGIDVKLNDTIYELKLVRSIGLNERSEVKLSINDTSVKAGLYYKRYKTADEYQAAEFIYKVYPVHSFIMNKIFKITEEKGLFADIPPQPAAGKLQYYIEIADLSGTQTIMKDTPLVIRFKESVPWYILVPHILIMFTAMLFSTATGFMSVSNVPEYKKFGIWTLILLAVGGIILGPLVQKIAFGELWTGVPFGWDLTDNKTLIALTFWVLAVLVNLKKRRPLYMALAAIILLLIFSIPHSLFGSEFDYSTGEVIQGISFTFSLVKRKKFLN